MVLSFLRYLLPLLFSFDFPPRLMVRTTVWSLISCVLFKVFHKLRCFGTWVLYWLILFVLYGTIFLLYCRYKPLCSWFLWLYLFSYLISPALLCFLLSTGFYLLFLRFHRLSPYPTYWQVCRLLVVLWRFLWRSPSLVSSLRAALCSYSGVLLWIR